MAYVTTSFNPSSNHYIDLSHCRQVAVGVDHPWELSAWETVPQSSRINWVVVAQQQEETCAFSSTVEPNACVWSVHENGNISFMEYIWPAPTMGSSSSTMYPKGSNQQQQQVVDATDSPQQPFVMTTTNSGGWVHHANATPYSAPVPTPNNDGIMYVARDTNGTTRLLYDDRKEKKKNESLTTATAVVVLENPLPDATLAYSTQHEAYAVYTDETTQRYTHCIFGDCGEAHRLSIVQVNDDDLNNNNNWTEMLTITLPGNDWVFEGLGPMWADVNDDGIDDLLTTVSATGKGSQLRVYLLQTDDKGHLSIIQNQAESPFIGTGNRWRHQLAVGPLGPLGETEIWEIQTPHIGGRLQAHRLSRDDLVLEKVATATLDYTSHDIGSRNLDMVSVGDFDGDGRPEIAVQNQRKTMLTGLQRHEDGFVEVWSVPLTQGGLSSNLAVSCSDEMVALFGGTQGQPSLLAIVFTPREVSSPSQEPYNIPPPHTSDRDPSSSRRISCCYSVWMTMVVTATLLFDLLCRANKFEIKDKKMSPTVRQTAHSLESC